MSVHIKIATTTAEYDSLFQLRHRVFVEQEGYMTPAADGRIHDRWDAFPSTANVVGLVGEQVVASVRCAAPSAAGLPAESYFDFRPHMPDPNHTASVSLVCADQRYRNVPRLTMSIMAMACYWAISRGLTHIVAPCNPDVERYFAKQGFRPLADTFFDADKGLHVLPMILDLALEGDEFLRFVRRQKIDHFMTSFDRQFSVAGEAIIRQGEPSHSAYVVVQGQVDVLREPERPESIVATFGPGDMFGELALLTTRKRTATVVARTDVDLMVLERDLVMSQIDQNPSAARSMLEFLGNRLADTVTALNRLLLEKTNE